MTSFSQELELVVAYDTETALIDAGILAPPLACVTFCDQTLVPSLTYWQDSLEPLRKMLLTNKIVGHNVAYDMAVIASQFPELLELVFDAYQQARVVDTRLNQRLLDLAVGELDGYYNSTGSWVKRFYSLSALSARYGFGELEKDQYRLKYGEYRQIQLAQWPAGAIQYAKTDALRTFQVLCKQLEQEEFLLDAARQAQAAFALHLQSCRGLITNGARCDKFIKQTQQEIDLARELCFVNGLVDEEGKRKTKPAKERMTRVCHEQGMPVPMTEKGKDASDKWKPSVCLDAEACRESGDEVLRAYATYTSANTLLKKAELLKQGSRVPLQTSYETLLETGRTSSRAPMAPMVGDNFQNVRKASGMRECFVPRPGFVFCSIDFDMAELRTVSQICIWLFGQSKLADALNQDKDVHSILAGHLMGKPYEEVVANKKTEPYKKSREHGKMGNFLLWGGGGINMFVNTVNASAQTPDQKITAETGARIKEAWKKAWEPEPYFKWVSDAVGDGLGTYKSWLSGRVRANINYSTFANNGFQGLAADAAKSSLLPLARECYVDKKSPLYGSRPLLFIHDEVLFELREDCMHDAAFRARDIMVDSFNKWTPDVPVTATPALMRFWTKGAEAVYKDGKLVPWQPSP